MSSQSSWWSYLAVGSAAVATSLGLAYAYRSYTIEQKKDRKIARKRAAAAKAKQQSTGQVESKSSANTQPTRSASLAAALLSDSELRAMLTASLKNLRSQYQCDGALERRTLETLRRQFAVERGAAGSNTSTPKSLHSKHHKPTHRTISASAVAAATAHNSASADAMRLYQTETRVLAAQWLLLYHSLQQLVLYAEEATAANGEGETDLSSATAARHQQNDSDLEMAWRLLKLKRISAAADAGTVTSVTTTTPAAGTTVTTGAADQPLPLPPVPVSRLDVATRLRSIKRMSRSLDAFVSRYCPSGSDGTSSAAIASAAAQLRKQLTDTEIGIALVSACQLGRWSAVARFGAALSAGAVNAYHTAAAEQPVTDYAVVCRIVSIALAGTGGIPKAPTNTTEYGVRSDVSIGDVRFCTYAVRQLQIRVKNIHCRDQSIVSSIASEYAPNTGQDWKAIAFDARYPHRLTRSGAVVHMLSLSSCPIPMAGIITPTHLTMYGYADVSPQVTSVHQTELYRLTRQTNELVSGATTAPTTAQTTTGAATTTTTTTTTAPAESNRVLTYAGVYEFTHRPVIAAATGAGSGGPNTAPEAEDLRVNFDVRLVLEVL